MLGALLNWIGAHASAIQTLGTVVLVGITWWYVRLTKRLVDNGREQLAETRAMFEAQTGIGRAKLSAHAARLMETLNGLPAQNVHETQLRHCNMWSEGDERTLHDLGALLGPQMVEGVAETVASLVWIRQLYNRIADVNPAMGYRVADAENRNMTMHRERALAHLREMERMA